jgi:hypothetical protein
LSHSPNVSKLSQKELISLYLEVQKSTGRENLYKLAKVATTPKEPPPTPAAQAVPGEALTGTPLEAVDPEIQALQAEVNALKRKLSESLAPETPSLTREQKILKLAKDTPGNMFFLMMILMSLMGAMEK